MVLSEKVGFCSRLQLFGQLTVKWQFIIVTDTAEVVEAVVLVATRLQLLFFSRGSILT